MKTTTKSKKEITLKLNFSTLANVFITLPRSREFTAVCLNQMSSDDLVNLINKSRHNESPWTMKEDLINIIYQHCSKEKITEDVMIAAINKSYLSIKLFDNLSERVQLAAVKKNIRSLEFIENPSENVQMFAFKKARKTAIKLLKKPCLKVQALINFM
jgi:hypothetical protein